MDPNYPDYRIAAVLCLSDRYPELPWSEVMAANFEPVPPTGCWRTSFGSRRWFYVYVGNHPKAPSVEEIKRDQFDRHYGPIELQEREAEMLALNSNPGPLRDYGISIGRRLHLKSTLERALTEPWKGEPSWLKQMIPDDAKRREHWAQTLIDAGVQPPAPPTPEPPPPESSPPSSDPNAEQQWDELQRSVQDDVRKADRDLIVFGGAIALAVIVGVVAGVIPPFAIVSLGVGGILIWQKNR